MWNADQKHAVSPSSARFETYHGAKWFQHELDKGGETSGGIFDLAMDGANTADVYLICDKLLRGTHCPKLIIYGIADRDIATGVFHSERNDPAFNLLFEPKDCERLGYLFTTDLQERIDLELYERFALYKSRQMIQEHTAQWGHRFEDRLCTIFDPRLATSGHLQMRRIYSDNEQEFTSRYGQAWAMSKKLMKKQEECLILLSSLAEKRNCSLLLVNMPMKRRGPKTAENYIRYQRLLDLCATKPHTYLLDLTNHDSAFQSECFLDGAHLNATGGERLITRLTDWIEKHKKAITSRS
jgi:hypothetical protein